MRLDQSKLSLLATFLSTPLPASPCSPSLPPGRVMLSSLSAQFLAVLVLDDYALDLGVRGCGLAGCGLAGG